ncbi:glycine cleavage system P-protein-domain-containing protein [Melanogaster broomeanus]|nr:glycine cleavage system P-protein-domain-containing protein [Melanogaster broomeanus]
MAAVRSASALRKSFLGRSLATAKAPATLFDSLDTFTDRHVGPDDSETAFMLSKLGYDSMESFLAATVPPKIRIAAATSELQARAKALGKKNLQFKSYIGMGYHNAVVPLVILRNVMENPAWYTPYTPYQPEIAQGRLESLVNYQTMIMSLTAMDIANASLLDEATAAAEGMVMAYVNSGQKKKTFFVDKAVLPQTVAALAFRLVVGDATTALKDEALRADLSGVLVQYPDVNGQITNYTELSKDVHATGALVVCATDLLALTLLTPPGEWGADIVLGNSARFGVPAGYGGPHGAFFAVTDSLKRKMPGRLIGRSKDTMGNPAYRLALQTREQHIRREKATSNICTSQALLANMAAMYAVYHGPVGLTRIAKKVHLFTQLLRASIERLGFKVVNDAYFDTLTIDVSAVCKNAEIVHAAAALQFVNLRRIDSTHVGVTLDESVSQEDLKVLLQVFATAASGPKEILLTDTPQPGSTAIPSSLTRTSEFLSQPVFNTHHSETEMLRYIFHLASKDLSLVHAMIPLGSCTMKLNSTSSMIPLTWPEFGGVHPFAPLIRWKGLHYTQELEADLCKITGFHSCSVQPNSGAAGEYAGLNVIRAYHESRGEGHRDVCLIPLSAHGTNPASAVMAGLKVVPVKTHADGNLDLTDLKAKAEKHKDTLAAFMITYPSTFGVFEDGIIHEYGGQVYLDGANLNAQVGLTNPAVCGGDVCHLNLHKTFAIPHGGGGPGVGPICVAEHLAPFLPSHPLVETGGDKAIDAVSAGPFGSASILLISWAYVKMLGGNGLSQSTNAYYTLRFKNANGRVAHELLIDLAEFDKAAGLKVTDFAKRLQDYGFHPPTCSWPISTCMLIEPTESETLEEVDKFCDAMIQIRKEVDDIISGKQPKDNNVLKNAPHPLSAIVLSDKEWNRGCVSYAWLREKKFWPTVSRIDDAYGDLNLVCDCPSVEELSSS